MDESSDDPAFSLVNGSEPVEGMIATGSGTGHYLLAGAGASSSAGRSSVCALAHL